MIALVALAAALDATPVVLRPRSAEAHAARYVRLRLDVTSMGIAGRGEIVVDRTTGAFVRRFDAGPASERDGWDGTTVWHADATAMPRVEGNPDERAAVVTWARLFAPVAGASPPPASRAPDVTTDRAHDETVVVLHVGAWTERVTFAGSRAEDNFAAPATITDTSENGVWTARVTGVETPRTVPAATFEPPAPPDDATLHGVTTIPIGGDGAYPIVEVALDGGPPMRFVLDTGGQNAITVQAARRAHLQPVGTATVSGVGAALAPAAFTTVRTMRIGTAELRDQPFFVLDLGDAPIDGIIGYEVLARFAARIDLVHLRVQLARDARDLEPGGVAVRMSLDDRQPQVDGALDGIPGTMTIDTGSAGSVDVESPFVAAHDLRARMHAVAGGTASGVGGAVHGAVARAKELRLGSVVVPSPLVFLTDERAGGYADPTIAANIGNQVLRRFALVLDYRNATIRFEPAAGGRIGNGATATHSPSAAPT